jgi:L-seryl-tRNA(Ser) seleniumtransferase
VTNLQSLPSVDKVLQTTPAQEMIAHYGRPLTVNAIRAAIEEVRSRVLDGGEDTIPSIDRLISRVSILLYDWTAPTLRPVINATGVILHTNLGRAPLSVDAIHAMDAVSRGYSTLEYDLAKGARGSRLIHAESILKQITGAEAAMVVNNNASAVLLLLSALASKKKVVISRTQLVEIGGGFRVPDVMKQSGAKLLEIGTTNRVHLSDYESALAENPALFMRAHRSNFKIIGFTEEPELKEIAALAHSAGIPFVDDLGSGSLIDTAKYDLGHEPTIQESLSAGSDLICFSGDKLFGGPQAGIIIGRADLIAKIKKHPLARAVRADKLCLAALTATLLHYLKDEAEHKIPIWHMISTPLKTIKARAESWARVIDQGEVIRGESTVGGGSLPGEEMPTWLLAITIKSPDKFLEKLRKQNPPLIARTLDDRVVFDPRTVLPEQDGALLVALQNTLKKK